MNGKSIFLPFTRITSSTPTTTADSGTKTALKEKNYNKLGLHILASAINNADIQPVSPTDPSKSNITEQMRTDVNIDNSHDFRQIYSHPYISNKYHLGSYLNGSK
ncbi:unnamed protein product [Rhizopus stolonifer]